MKIRQLLAFGLAVVLIAAGVNLALFDVLHGQNAGQIGATSVPGFYSWANNSTSFSPSLTTGAAGTVTNPASNFLMQVDGGPVYCAGGQSDIAESNVQLAANNTYLVVFNCATSTIYSKTAVVAPGGQIPSTSGGSPGTPGTFLAPIAGVEISLATVVCNGTACGNGGNGTITDSRTALNFPNGAQLSKIAFGSLNASAPDGAMVICTACTQPTTGSVTCATGAVNVMAVRVAGAWRCY